MSQTLFTQQDYLTKRSALDTLYEAALKSIDALDAVKSKEEYDAKVEEAKDQLQEYETAYERACDRLNGWEGLTPDQKDELVQWRDTKKLLFVRTRYTA